MIRELRKRVDDQFPGAMLLAEANQWPADLRPYFGNGDEFHMAFHFPLMPRMFMGLRLEDRKPITEILQQTPEIPASCQWCLFLRNHDELTLEMVTDIERDYMYDIYAATRHAIESRYPAAPGAPARQRSPANRIDEWHADVAARHSYHLLRRRDRHGGQYLPGRSQWRTNADAVERRLEWRLFTADPESLYSPPILNPVYGYQAVNVLSQKRTEHSLLSWMKHIIQIRRSSPVFGSGSIEFLYPANHRILAYVRQLGKETILGREQSLQRRASGRTGSATLQGKYSD